MARISRILLPVAFSDRCKGAAQYAEALACHFHAELVLLHVVAPITTYGCPDAVVLPPELAEETIERSRGELDAFFSGEFQGISVKRDLLEGDPAREIVQYAEEGNFDLIVMPTHGYGPFRRFLLGSVTAKVLHDAHCPVWTGPHMEATPAYTSISFRKILCAIDLGPYSRAVLEWGAGLAKEYGSDLAVVHTIPASTVKLGGFYFDPEWRAHVIKEARERITFLQEELHIGGDVLIETGDVAPTVRSVAEDWQANVVVIGRGQHSGGLRGLRAHAYGILRESPCPVAAI